MKLGHDTQTFPLLSILGHFPSRLALFLLVALGSPVIISCGSLFSFGFVWIYIRKFLISDPVLWRFTWLSLALSRWF